MKMKSNDLGGLALEWAVANCEGRVGDFCYVTPGDGQAYCEGRVPDGVLSAPESAFDVCISALKYATDWAGSGSIVERLIQGGFELRTAPFSADFQCIQGSTGIAGYGATPLVAALRAFVLQKLGPEVDVPDALLPAPTQTARPKP